MNGYGINHECYQRPCLFRVPAPVGTPADVRPDSPDENSEAKACYRWVKKQPGKVSKAVAGFRPACQADACDAAYECYREHSVRHHHQAYVQA